MVLLNDKPVLAVDIGGTKILTALFSPGWEILGRLESTTEVAGGVEAVIERIELSITAVLDEAEVAPSNLAGVGIACAGGVDSNRGIIVTPSPNMPDWQDIPLRDILAESFNVPVSLVNDASAAALGEHRFGAGKGSPNLVLLTLGTGIGGGIVIDGRMYLGSVGAAGEIGHMSVAEGPGCGCGNLGCLELFASGTAVERDARSRLKRGEPSSLRSDSGYQPEAVTARMVAQAARNGDKLAGEVLDKAAHYLGIGIINVVNIFNPDMVLIGGGMSAIGERLIGPARRIVAERAFGISARETVIRAAELGNDAGVYGAAAFVRDTIV